MTLMVGLAACGTGSTAFGGGAGSVRTQTTSTARTHTQTTVSTATPTRTTVSTATQTTGGTGTQSTAGTGTQTATGTATGAHTRTNPPPGRSSGRASLSGQLRLAHTTVPEGGVLQAELILQSTADHRRVLDRACPGQFIALVLSGPGGTSSILWTSQVCRPGVPFVAQPGTTIYPLQARATVGQCILIGHKPPANVPQCLSGNRLPPLPPGNYEASITAHDPVLAADLAGVRPVEVRVTP